MNVIDSSAWLEYIGNGPNKPHFEGAILDKANLLVPTIVLYEVFKRIYIQSGEQLALQATLVMQQGTIVDITPNIAIHAAKRSADLKLPMADALIWTIAELYQATLWTQDQHFSNLANVRYFAK